MLVNYNKLIKINTEICNNSQGQNLNYIFASAVKPLFLMKHNFRGSNLD